ncbi:methyltransferase domain-containing protein [Streptomyces sp. NPDC094447]|uniref:methyltransferase domain-containing protein n=1 Tax=Streptomyces sp. NPDC094447 TaxID=3366062 RepID=UPI0037F4EB91
MTVFANAGVGQGIAVANAGWTFSGPTAESFGEHVRRSVPSYEEGHQLIEKISDFFVRPESTVYEIGTSQGELLCRLAERHERHGDARWIGLDIEPDMVAQASARLAHIDNAVAETADIVSYEMDKADLILSYYSLQFVAPKHRQKVVDEIYDTLNWGGAFIWFEKIRGSDARFQDLFSLLYTDFKLEQHFTPDEIIAKSRSLKGVMEPFSSEANREMLRRAGFVDVMPVFRNLCFEGVLAVK